MALHVDDSVVISGWLSKYSRIQKQLRKRYVVVTSLNETGEKKKICTYKTEEASSNEKNATEVILMNDVYNIIEYFGPLNTQQDDVHFIVNDTFVFKCNSEDEEALWMNNERNLWISKIITTHQSAQHQKRAQSRSQSQSQLQSHSTPINGGSKPFFSEVFDTLGGLKQRIKLADTMQESTMKIKNTSENVANIAVVCEDTISGNKDFIMVGIIGALSDNDKSIWKLCANGIKNEIQLFINIIKDVIDEIKQPLSGDITVVLMDQDGEIKTLDLEGRGDGDGGGARYTNGKDIIKDCVDNGYYVSVKSQYKYCRSFESVRNNDIVNYNVDNYSSGGIYSIDTKEICDRGLSCPILSSLKKNKIHGIAKRNYNHMIMFDHFDKNINNKPVCRAGTKCGVFIRMINERMERLDDACHLLVYRHPPRHERQLELNNDINKLVLTKENKKKIGKIKDAGTSSFYSTKDLLFEIINNGFETDLFLSQQDFFSKSYSILKIVNRKLDSIKHKINYQSCLNRQLMFALVLYTHCQCIYDLCNNQRNGNYTKWSVFDSLLYNAIAKLSRFEKLEGISLYSGLSNDVTLKINKKRWNKCCFPTFVSCSWNKDVSMDFINDDDDNNNNNNKGSLIEIENATFTNNRIKCCSVDWISKFPDECEVLMARSDLKNDKKFDLILLDDQKYDFDYGFDGNMNVNIVLLSLETQETKSDNDDSDTDDNDNDNDNDDEKQISNNVNNAINITKDEEYFTDLLTFLLTTEFDVKNMCISCNTRIFGECESEMKMNSTDIDKYNKLVQCETMKLIQNNDLLIEIKEKILKAKAKVVGDDLTRFVVCSELQTMSVAFKQIINAFTKSNGENKGDRSIVNWLCQNPSFLFDAFL